MAQQNSLQQTFEQAQSGNKKSLFKLLDIGREKGFESFINRKLIWPFLLNLDNKKMKDTPVFQWKGGMNRQSVDYEQLQKDAERSLASMKTFQSITKFHLRKKQEAVLAVLDSFFAKNPELRYIQGFHDVASIFLILFGNSTGYYLMERAGRTYFYDFLTFEFGEVGCTVSKIVYDMVTMQDPDFKNIFASYEHSKFLIFILPWILTWFSHNFFSVKTICRIWDYLLCSGPHGVFYLTCGIILSTKSDLLENCDEMDEPSIQTFYQQQAKNSTIDLEKAIKVALQLENKYQIGDFAGYHQLQPNSMFRLNNFQQNISLHRQYHEHRKNSLKKSRMIGTATKIAAFAAVTALALLAVKYNGKMRSLGEL